MKRPARPDLAYGAACAVLFLLPTVSTAKELNGFDLSGALVPPDAIRRGGPPRDGIPAIDDPKFIDAEEAKRTYPEETRVLVVRLRGKIRAYPLGILDWHEVVNDNIGGTPIAVTWCPLCGSAMVFLSTIDGKTLELGVSGLLYQSAALFFDRATDSLWSQVMRKAITGKHKGKTLELVPCRVERLDDVLQEEKKVEILSLETGHRREYRRRPYLAYEQDSYLRFPVNHQDEKAPLKAWSLLLESEKSSLIVPLVHLDPARKKQILSVGGKEVTLTYDASKQLLHCENAGEGVTCISAYYFALRTFYPEAEVFSKQ